MKYLLSKGVNPTQKNENGQTAITSILYQVSQDCILFDHTQDQADELYSCIFQLFVYKVGLDEENLEEDHSHVYYCDVYRICQSSRGH